ncbi:MAG: hypothetical protein KDB27_02330 [Planctomycetales bacterium]|nr:hypothetical protein [Planctomycetales bacterium]
MKIFVRIVIVLMLVAPACTIAWFVSETQYVEAETLLRANRLTFASSAAARGADTDREAFELFIQTQADLIKSPFVLNMVLRHHGVASLPGVPRNSTEAFNWLKERLSVDHVENSEILTVRLRAKTNEESAKQLLDSVVVAYIKEVVGEENVRIVNQQKDVASRTRDIQEQMLAKQRQVSELTPFTKRHEQRTALYLDRLVDLEIDRSSTNDKAQIEAIDKRIAFLESRIVSADEELTEKLAAVEILKHEIDQLRNISNQLSDQAEQFRLALSRGSTVAVIQPARGVNEDSRY